MELNQMSIDDLVSRLICLCVCLTLKSLRRRSNHQRLTRRETFVHSISNVMAATNARSAGTLDSCVFKYALLLTNLQKAW
jgi:hypothetical protein